MGRIVGIDLGTTNSVVAVLEAGEPVIITLAEGSRLCPSVVSFTRQGERLVGSIAKRQAATNPERTFASVKRHMGTDSRLFVDERAYSIPEISAMVLQKLKIDAEAYLGETVDRAVITVPAYFNDGQRQATKDAGQIAGLDVVRILNEPTAAALAYGLDKGAGHTVLVWDLGGGTFDVSILTLGNGVFEVCATSGDTHLGGDDWDDMLVEWLAGEFQEATTVDLREDRLALQRLREAAERAKTELSAMLSTDINLPFLCQGPQGPLHLEKTITRAKFEGLTEALRDRMRNPTYQALNDARLAPSQIDTVVLVGGSTRMPAVQDMVREIFKKDPYKGMNPDEVVAAGAAIQAGIMAGELTNVVLLDVTPLSLGIETMGGVTTRLIARNTTIPTSKAELFTTAADGQSAVDIHILQGEREMAVDNKSLGHLLLTEIPPAPRGYPKIEVVFEIDSNGIVAVRARDKATGREQQIQVTPASGLTSDDVERLVEEARSFAESDRDRRLAQEVRNQADVLLYNAEKVLAQAQNELDAIQLRPARSSMTALVQALEGNDLDHIKQHIHELNHRVEFVTAALYGPMATPEQGGNSVS